MKPIQMFRRWAQVFVLAAGLVASPVKADDTVSLAGEWRFQLDRTDVGQGEHWFSSELPERIQLPGALQNQGFGDDVILETKWSGGIANRDFFTAPEYAPYRQPGNIKVPFWLQPEKHYVGAAWYQRDIEIPKQWKDRRVVLTLERPHWETRVWIDDRPVGTNNSLSTPHDYDLGTGLTPGKHRLTIRVDNRMVVDIGPESCSVSEHTQGNWNGIVGRIELASTSPVWIEDAQVYPDVAKKSVRIKVRIGNTTGRAGAGTLTVGSQSIPIKWDASGGQGEMEIQLNGQAQLWDEFHPALQRLKLRLSGDQADAGRELVFGLREVSVKGREFFLNGRKLFVRATCECGIFPKTGHPPTDVDSWKRIMRICQEHGLNFMRFHCFTPPEAAFTAADELGLYCLVDCSLWPNHPTTLGDNKPVDQWAYDEAERILKHYANHPSIVLASLGCEPGGKNREAYLSRWVSHFKAKESRQLFTCTSGWPEIPESQWQLMFQPRIYWAGSLGLKSRINAKPPETCFDYREFVGARNQPVVSNEAGQWCSYPDLDEIPKYTGNLKARNYEVFRDFLNVHHLGDQAGRFLLASGKLQTLCYKEEIESSLRTPGMAGFLLLDLHDFPGQGTAPVGVLNAFWESKGYVTAAEYRRFCNRTVPLARLAKRVFTTAENLRADIEVAHFGAAPLTNTVTTWKLVGDDDSVVASGQLPARTIPVDNGIALGSVDIPLRNVPAPQRYKLVVGLEGTPYGNDWDVWVYPQQVSVEPPTGVTVVRDLNDEALTALDAGGKVLLLIPPARVRNLAQNPVVLGFSTIFWNTSWSHRMPPTTMGILCDPKHPALAEFPTDYHSNWQWWYLISRAAPMILDDLPPSLQPVVQVVDDWFTAHKLALAFEAKVGKGKLLVSSMDLQNGLETNFVARQMLHSLLDYMGDDRFNPTVSVTADELARVLITPTTNTTNANVTAVSSEAPDYPAANVLDGNPSTIWHTPWTKSKVWEEKIPTFPHHIVLEFAKPMSVKGISCLPRQEYPTGRIKDYVVQVSDDSQTWREVASGSFDNTANAKQVLFAAPVTARYLKLNALSGFSKESFISLAELSIIPAKIIKSDRKESDFLK